MKTGVVRWFSEIIKLGIIRPDDGGADVFVTLPLHAFEHIEKLEVGQVVKFQSEQSDRGPQACKLELSEI